MAILLGAIFLCTFVNAAFSAIQTMQAQQEKIPMFILSTILRPRAFNRLDEPNFNHIFGPRLMVPSFNMPPQMLASPPPNQHSMIPPFHMPPMIPSPHMSAPFPTPPQLPLPAAHPLSSPAELDYYDAVKLEDEREHKHQQESLLNNFFDTLRTNVEPATVVVESKVPMAPFPAIVQPIQSPMNDAKVMPFAVIVKPVPPQEESQIDGALGEDKTKVTTNIKTKQETTEIPVPEVVDEEMNSKEHIPKESEVDGSVEDSQKDDPLPVPPMASVHFIK